MRFCEEIINMLMKKRKNGIALCQLMVLEEPVKVIHMYAGSLLMKKNVLDEADSFYQERLDGDNESTRK